VKTITAVKIIISVYLLTTMITTPTAIKTEQIPTEVPLTYSSISKNSMVSCVMGMHMGSEGYHY
jgi:hypothetical protein